MRLFSFSIFFAVLVAGVVFFVTRIQYFPPTAITQVQTPLHYSAYSQKDFFEKAFDAATPALLDAATQRIEGIVFNHHLLAPHFIAQALSTVATTSPITIVLISPNHFNVGRGQILTSRYSWSTPYGILESDIKLIDQLVGGGFLTLDEQPFEKEHGIANVVAFIKRSLPQAKVVPIIVKDALSDKKTDEFAASLGSIMPKNFLAAASLDFSHYQTLDVANQHDEVSLSVLKTLDWRGTSGLDIDSRPGLRMFLKLMTQVGATRFHLLQHSNSAIVSGLLSVSSTTSYINGYFSAP